MSIRSWWIFPPLGVQARLHTSVSLTSASCVSITTFMSGSFNVVFCVCTPSTGLWYNTRVRNGIDTMLEPKLEVRQGPCGSMKERTWEAFCRKTHTLQQKGCKAGLVALPLVGAVISRVQLMCSVEQVIYRVARDPNSLNVVRELVFQTFSNELWDTTLKIQLPQRDIRHKSKLSGVGRGVRDPPKWKRLTQGHTVGDRIKISNPEPLPLLTGIGRERGQLCYWRPSSLSSGVSGWKAQRESGEQT